MRETEAPRGLVATRAALERVGASGRRRARSARVLAVPALLVGLAGGPLSADAGARAAPGSEWQRLARELAAPWPALQQRSGHLLDALQPDGSSRYGDAMLGLGLLQTGARARDRRLIDTGLRAVTAAARKVDPWFATRPFEVWAVASSYNLAARRLRSYRPARRASRAWARWLRHQKTTYLQRGGYNNKYLVDALAVLELIRTRLHSRVPGTVLGSRRRYARRRALRLIRGAIPAMAETSEFILSDPVAHPPAYHALSFGLYARAARLLGRRVPPVAAPTLRELARSTHQVAAPDGDLAYWGRSMQQKWTLSAAAYGLAVTATLRGSGRAASARHRALANTFLRRLQAYGVGPRGEWLTPSLRQSFALGRYSLDTYARATEYTGLALVHLNWAESLLAGRRRSPITDGAPSQAIVGQDRGQFATVRIGNLWYAIKKEAGGEQGTGDLRYDFGLVAFKRLERGAWRDVIPLRPIGSGTAGPALLTDRGLAPPAGESMLTSPDGTVSIRGGFRDPHGGWARRGTEFVFRPSNGQRCLTMSVSAQPGDRYELSAFFRGEVPPRATSPSRRLASGGHVVEFSHPFEPATPQGGYALPQPSLASASDARVTRHRVVVRSRAAEPVTMTTC